MKDGWCETGPTIWSFYEHGKQRLVLLHQPWASTESKYWWREINGSTWWKLPSVTSIGEAQAVAVANWRMQ